MVKSVVPGISSNVKISECKMTSVNLEQVNFSYVECRTDTQSCAKKDTVLTFHPPVASMKEMRPRLVELHHDVLSPRFRWLVTDPICIFIIAITALFACITFVVNDLESALHAAVPVPALANHVMTLITAIFGSVQTLEDIIGKLLVFTVVAHVGEAIYAAYVCSKTLKLKKKNTFMWFVAICLTGWPMTSKVLEFSNIVVVEKKAKK
eukprot:CAMPEP_0204633288 /NCGR_PEP_ID=MMETSP0717-20131115/26834_1 /ASSEMBLY_ACC=CAM_ASM_000666 /TAXON_ID=230516 /ORGANISM="Chaetoceros curvisetus" /LENGTH=207 /DNA_ID=CAMNT_0051651401 /DNA_START=1 /DNA_END=624 /DNA_ORIENTATION=-